MLEFDIINQILTSLCGVLTPAMSGYFVICVVGFMTREDEYGVSSFIRAHDFPAWCCKRCYYRLLDFFRNGKIKIDILERKWWHIADTIMYPFEIKGYQVLIADGTKVQKEGKRMPGVKKLGQTSEDQTKPKYMWGNMFQSLSMLCASNDCMVAAPLTMPIVDGVAATSSWEGSPYTDDSQLVKMINDACKISLELNKSNLVLADRYYLSRPVLKILLSHNAKNAEAIVHLITKVKKSYSAYLPLTPEEEKDKRRKKGDKVKIFDYFDDSNTIFEKITVTLYNKERKARVASKKLLWGYGLYVPMLFILVEYYDDEKGVTRREVLASTETSLSAVEIMKLYSYRFKIEFQFKAMKSDLGTFTYRFWSKAQPILSKKRKKGDPDPLEAVTDPKERQNILDTLRATTLFVFCGMVAQGIIQAIALRFSEEGDLKKLRFQVTEAAKVPSEANVMYIIRKNFEKYMLKNPTSFVSLAIERTIYKIWWSEFRKSAKEAI